MPKEDGDGTSKALHAEVAVCQQALRVIDYTCGLLVKLGAAQMYWMRHPPCVTSVRCGKPNLNGSACFAAAPRVCEQADRYQQILESD